MLKATEASATRAVLQKKGVLKTPTQVLSCEIGKYLLRCSVSRKATGCKCVASIKIKSFTDIFQGFFVINLGSGKYVFSRTPPLSAPKH